MRTGNAQVARMGGVARMGARLLLAQLRILATSLTAVKEEEKMRLAQGEQTRLAQNPLSAHRGIPGKQNTGPCRDPLSAQSCKISTTKI